MGGADFSDHPYTYAPVENDINLDHFELTDEDNNLKVFIAWNGNIFFVMSVYSCTKII